MTQSVVGKHRLPMSIALYLGKCQIAKAPFLGAHTDCLTSELENASCCLLVPAGFNEKCHCILTETQPSRRSMGVWVLILLFEQAVYVFPKPQNQPDMCLDPICLDQKVACTMVLCEGSIWVFADAVTVVLLPYLGKADRCLLAKPSLFHILSYKTFRTRYVCSITCKCPSVTLLHSIALRVVPLSLLNDIWQYFIPV